MIKLAVIKKDGTWEEKKVRIPSDPQGDNLATALYYLSDKGFKFPEGVVQVTILPDNWKLLKRK